KTNVASGACSRAACSRLSVPFALTLKSVCGSVAAQSCDGCAAVWTISSIADVELDAVERVVGVEQLARGVRRRCLRTEEAGAHVVLDPNDVEADAREAMDRGGPDQPPGACDDRDWHSPVPPLLMRC